MIEGLGLSPMGLAIAWFSVFVGAVVQGSIGFGLNLIAVPVLAALRPEVLPAASIILALPMTFGSALRERTHIDRSAVGWTTLGRVPGVALGAFVVSVLTPGGLALLIGCLVLMAVGMSAAAPTIPIDRRSLMSVGFLGGMMGTASSIGGPPMALLFQKEAGPRMRSTLGAAFLIGTGMSLLGLMFAGAVTTRHWQFGLSMTPAVVFGLFVSRYAHGWLERGWLRPCVLAFSALAGLGVVLRGLAALTT